MRFGLDMDFFPPGTTTSSTSSPEGPELDIPLVIYVDLLILSILTEMLPLN